VSTIILIAYLHFFLLVTVKLKLILVHSTVVHIQILPNLLCNRSITLLEVVVNCSCQKKWTGNNSEWYSAKSKHFNVFFSDSILRIL